MTHTGISVGWVGITTEEQVDHVVHHGVMFAWWWWLVGLLDHECATAVGGLLGVFFTPFHSPNITKNAKYINSINSICQQRAKCS